VTPETLQRIADRRRDQLRQQHLIRETDLYHETIRTKLSGLFRGNQMQNFTRCGHDRIYRTCKNCGDCENFEYHCSIKWCPRCNWRITTKRQEIISKWIQTIKQPKHVVTTQRNTETLTNRMIREHTRNLSRLRRTKLFSKVTGGCVSVEVTNESRGWHLHAHWLLDVRWLDAEELSRTWGKLVGQQFAIVKIKDLRHRIEYQREVAKYVVKGSEMARWHPEEIHQFVRAVRGKRFFFTFGALFKQARALRNKERPQPIMCACGCNKFVFRDELAQILHCRG
jgi:hypothetical protein